MPFPATNAGADPDPTTQIAWPSRNGKRRDPASDQAESAEDGQSSTAAAGGKRTRTPERDGDGDRRMSTVDLMKLSVSMAGSQVAWTVELGYGTPFLLSLGLSETLTSLVWLAGPISGLIAQPVIGAISDASTSKYRRRYWVVLSTIVLVISTLTLAYCQQIAAVFVDLFGGGAGSWDPQWIKQVQNTAIALAVISFYLLDFALNALQASLRNLLLDITPPSQLNAGNAWHSRMLNAGNILGYGFGFLPLANMPILRLLGGDQFRKFCVVSMAILVITVWITCWTQEEKERQSRLIEKENKLRDVLDNIYNAIVHLPKPIRRVCYVQIFAFMGWFPFLFYATTYIGQVMAYELQTDPDKDTATRMGEFAMLIYSIVAVVAGATLPRLARRDTRLLAHEGDDEDEDAELARLRATVMEWRSDAARKGQPLRLPWMPFFLRNIWSGAMILFAVITFSTFFITKVWQAVIAVSLVGICWAVACWCPFAIIMEFLKEREREHSAEESAPAAGESVNRPSHSRTRSTPAVVRRQSDASERAPLLRRRRSFNQDEIDATPSETQPLAGGTVLGIHNLAIVFPQFIVALVSSAIFHVVDADIDNDPAHHTTYYGKNGVAWVLRFGGLCALCGAAFARMVPPTRTEKEMRRRLAELKVLQEEDAP
ncbi:major facilitator superfamily domain-containing protein [Fomitopsis serialis]|uniref:major facilitator superfamily domain-containing protein n=1 Tax=Fomitopsis serialis TaxID=139415 RepID=UPI00200799AB|nr:major facilitator superfamily domain-containing protein [Neoantrodia serialis]KAH9938239.1 major facilitator superfamily domain-containing protein [Neoantrodia serialis]